MCVRIAAMRGRLRTLFSLVLLHAAAAEDYQPGDRVVVIAQAKLTVKGSREVDDVWPGLVLKVAAVDGRWLWVSNGKPGWLDRRHVIPLDRRAIDRLTAMIRADPGNTRLYGGRADVWENLGEIDIAIGDCSEAIRLDPKGLPATTTAATRGRPRASTTRRLPTTPRPSGSTRNTPRHTTTAATPAAKGRPRQGDRRLHRGHPARPEIRRGVLQPRHGMEARARTTRRLPTTPRPSGSIRNDAKAYYSRGMAVAGQRRARQGDCRLHRGHPARPERCRGVLQPRHRLTGKATTTRRLPTTPRPSGSTRNMPKRTTAAWPRLEEQGRLRQGDRRLHRGHPAQSEICRCVQQPRQRLAGQRRARQGDRRLHRGHPAQPERCRGVLQPRRRLAEKATRTRRSPTTPRPSGSIPEYARRTTTAASPGGKGENDKAIADYTEAIRLDRR